MFPNQLKIALKISIVVLLSSFLGGKNINDTKLQLDLIYTICAFIIADFATKKLQKQINQIDAKIGKKIAGDIVGPAVMFLSKALLSRAPINQKYLLKILFVIIGFACYNIFVSEKLNNAKIDQDIKDIIADIAKPFIMLMVSGYLQSGENPLNAQAIRNALFTANGFVANTIVVKAAGI
jgi:hypothetical protein